MKSSGNRKLLLNFKGENSLEILRLNCEGEPKGRLAKIQSENFRCQCVSFLVFVAIVNIYYVNFD